MSILRSAILTGILVALLICGRIALAQPDPVAGVLPFSTHQVGNYDSIDASSGNIMITIPILQRAGKHPFTFQLIGNFHAYVYGFPGVWVIPNGTLLGTGGIKGVDSGNL